VTGEGRRGLNPVSLFPFLHCSPAPHEECGELGVNNDGSLRPKDCSEGSYLAGPGRVLFVLDDRGDGEEERFLAGRSRCLISVFNKVTWLWNSLAFSPAGTRG